MNFMRVLNHLPVWDPKTDRRFLSEFGTGYRKTFLDQTLSSYFIKQV